MKLPIETRRLTLRFVTAGDWERILDIWTDFSGSPYACYDAPHDLDPKAVQASTARMESLSPRGEHMFFAVCLGAAVIGCVDFHRTPEGYACGYCFHSGAQGRGYASESLRALIDALADGGARRFVAGTALNNAPSVRLLEAVGFRMTGTERVSFYADARGEPIWFEGGIFELERE